MTEDEVRAALAAHLTTHPRPQLPTLDALLWAVLADPEVDPAVADLLADRMRDQPRPDRYAARHPGRGRKVLACRCGTALDLADMRRPPDPTRRSAVIDPICCQECAR